LLLATAGSLSLGGQRPDSAITLLERYAAGQFEAVVADLDRLDDFQPVLRDLNDHAGEWIAAGGMADRARRELAAATFALEAARVDAWREWKWLQKAPPNTSPQPTLYWKPPPLLIEWGCRLLRTEVTPKPIERTWQLAAMSVGHLSEDAQFLTGFTELPQPAEPAPAPSPAPTVRGPVRVLPGPVNRGIEVINAQHEIGHLNHVWERFPQEKRFLLGQGIARERDAPHDAVRIYTALADEQDVAGEATMRLGALHVRQNRLQNGLEAFDRAERLTRDPYVIYLAKFLRGQAFVRMKRDSDATAAFRGALATLPATESASVALAELLFKAGQRTEAQALMADVLAADPRPRDPYLWFVHGDDRFWPQLIARLRRELVR
jgi:tetratricopeptide (TPR) repeat protein